MALFSTMQILAVSICVSVPATYSASIISQGIARRPPGNDVSDPLTSLLRLTREAVHDDVYDNPPTAGPCSMASECWHGRHMEFLTELLHVNMDYLVKHMDAYCPELNATSCLDESCQVTSLKGLVRLGVNIERWACNRQIEFRHGAACWAPPFQEIMSLCQLAAYEATDGKDLASALRNCLESMIMNLNSCSLDDQKLFLEFADYVIDEHLDYYYS